IALQSLKPIENLINLEELYCDNSRITTLAPLRKLKKLKKISFGSKVNKFSVVADLVNLEELYIKGCKQVPDLSNLKNLKKLSITENELVIVSSSHRITNIDFLKNVKEMEFLDFNLTSYRGSLQVLNDLPHLKAVTLPRVSRTLVSAFKKISKNCVLINSFEFE
ncbi:MAG: hypothetical protein ABIN89_28365, partial [Chitinophagaceae bacterium]